MTSRRYYPGWWGEAWEMKQEGVPYKEIAKRTGKSIGHIRKLLMPGRRAYLENVNLTYRKKKQQERGHRGVCFHKLEISDEGAWVVIHEYRIPRRIIAPPSEIMKAAREFARGGLTRYQLMARVDNVL